MTIINLSLKAILFYFSESIISHLGYEHMWVQLASCQLIGLLFAAWTPEEILQPVEKSGQTDFIKTDSINKVLFFVQFTPNSVTVEYY